MSADPGEVTKLLHAFKQGDCGAEERLISMVYGELRRIARLHLRHESPDNSLQPTALVHEAYFRLTGTREIAWRDRAHFFAVSANIMRRILVDHARGRRASKRGDGWDAVSLNHAALPAPQRAPDLIALDDALTRLANLDERQSRVVEMRFFAGMNEDETGKVLGISSRTVKRDWRIARAWLFKELNC